MGCANRQSGCEAILRNGREPRGYRCNERGGMVLPGGLWRQEGQGESFRFALLHWRTRWPKPRACCEVTTAWDTMIREPATYSDHVKRHRRFQPHLSDTGGINTITVHRITERKRPAGVRWEQSSAQGRL